MQIVNQEKGTVCDSKVVITFLSTMTLASFKFSKFQLSSFYLKQWRPIFSASMLFSSRGRRHRWRRRRRCRRRQRREVNVAWKSWLDWFCCLNVFALAQFAPQSWAKMVRTSVKVTNRKYEDAIAFPSYFSPFLIWQIISLSRILIWCRLRLIYVYATNAILIGH